MNLSSLPELILIIHFFNEIITWTQTPISYTNWSVSFAYLSATTSQYRPSPHTPFAHPPYYLYFLYLFQNFKSPFYNYPGP